MARRYYTSSRLQYYRTRGNRAIEEQQQALRERRDWARRNGVSYLIVDIEYLLHRRMQAVFRWLALLKWLREGLLQSGIQAHRDLLWSIGAGQIDIRPTGAAVQDARATIEDCQAAHLMHCNLRLSYQGRSCAAFELLKGVNEEARDYRAFVTNIFAGTAWVFGIVNEIDSYLELKGIKDTLVSLTARVLRQGMDPQMALGAFRDAYKAHLLRCKTDYVEVVRGYAAGANSLEARVAKDQDLSTLMKKERKQTLFDVYYDIVDSYPGVDPMIARTSELAYRMRHEKWGRTPNRLTD